MKSCCIMYQTISQKRMSNETALKYYYDNKEDIEYKAN